MSKKFKKTPIGEIPVEWECRSIGDLVTEDGEIRIGPFGSSLKKSDLSPTGFKVYGQENIINNDFSIGDRFISEKKFSELKTYQIFPGDLVVTMMGTIGLSRLVPKGIAPGIMDSHLLRIRFGSPRVDPVYIGKCLHEYSAVKAQISSMSQGGIMSGLNSKIIRALQVPLPSAREQGKIVEILSAVDDAIQKTEAVIEKSQELKSCVRAEFLHKGIGHKKFKGTDIGRIPSAWALVRLEDVCEKIQDGTHFSPKTTSGPFMYITSKNIRMGFMDMTNVGFISAEEHRDIYKRCDVRYGDVFLTKDGASAGNITVNSINEEFSLLSSVAMLRPNKEKVLAEWIYQFFASEKGQNIMANQISGLAITRLTLEKIRNLPIAVPPLNEQREMTASLEAIEAMIRNDKLVKAKLDEMKQALMQMLLTGKVRV